VLIATYDAKGLKGYIISNTRQTREAANPCGVPKMIRLCVCPWMTLKRGRGAWTSVGSAARCWSGWTAWSEQRRGRRK
jgi:hypothetical protein